LISTDFNGAQHVRTSRDLDGVEHQPGALAGSYSAASMPSGWNDRVSSAQSAHGCASNIHFHNTTSGCGDHLHLLDDGRDEQPDLQRDLEPVTAAAGAARRPPAMPVRRPVTPPARSGTP
jgi:hypothetical protein